MASIVGPIGSGAKVAYKVTITRTKQGYRETRSFPTLKQAEAWGKKREKEVDHAIANGLPVTKQKNEGLTLADAISKYTAETMKAAGRTKTQVLQTIRNEYQISKMRCDAIKSTDIVSFAQELHKRPTLTSPATVLNYLSHLQAVFTLAGPAWGLPLDPKEMDAAMIVCRTLGLTAKGKSRERRPTLAELDLLMEHFISVNKARPNSVPMHKIIAFAIFSCRRQEEIIKMKWEDYDEKNKRVIIRDMKNPGDKAGNDVRCNLPDPCTDIIKSMPKISERIFPYSTDAISASFTRACKKLNIADLVFHDLRHEGTSRLFELGFAIPDAAQVTGHRTWQSLQRYTHIIESGNKYENWNWLPVVTSKTTVRLNKKK